MTSMHWGEVDTKGLKFTPEGLSGTILVAPKSEGGKASEAVSLMLQASRAGDFLQGSVDAGQGPRPLSGRISPQGQEATAAYIQLQTPYKGRNNDPRYNGWAARGSVLLEFQGNDLKSSHFMDAIRLSHYGSQANGLMVVSGDGNGTASVSGLAVLPAPKGTLSPQTMILERRVQRILCR